jgi:hypothetical protein
MGPLSSRSTRSRGWCCVSAPPMLVLDRGIFDISGGQRDVLEGPREPWDASSQSSRNKPRATHPHTPRRRRTSRSPGRDITLGAGYIADLRRRACFRGRGQRPNDRKRPHCLRQYWVPILVRRTPPTASLRLARPARSEMGRPRPRNIHRRRPDRVIAERAVPAIPFAYVFAGPEPLADRCSRAMVRPLGASATAIPATAAWGFPGRIARQSAVLVPGLFAAVRYVRQFACLQPLRPGRCGACRRETGAAGRRAPIAICAEWGTRCFVPNPPGP